MLLLRKSEWQYDEKAKTMIVSGTGVVTVGGWKDEDLDYIQKTPEYWNPIGSLKLK